MMPTLLEIGSTICGHTILSYIPIFQIYESAMYKNIAMVSGSKNLDTKILGTVTHIEKTGRIYDQDILLTLSDGTIHTVEFNSHYYEIN
jgi:hypothetical protein